MLEDRHGRTIIAPVLAVALFGAMGSIGCRPTSPTPATAGGAPSSRPPPASSASPTTAFRVESSLGLQIKVPSHWAVNDYGCNMTDRPSVVRGVGVERMCLTPEKPTKEVAIIGTDAETRDQLIALGELSKRPVRLGSVDAERAEGRSSDGRYVGWLRVPSRGVTVLVKAVELATVQRILDSAGLASIDQHGCPERRPVVQGPAKPGAAAPAAAARFVPENPNEISICYYGEHGDRLKSSATLRGEEAVALARMLNAAAPGATPDADPRECLHPPAPPPPDALLLVHTGAAPVSIYVTFSGCVGRKLDNGIRDAHVDAEIVRKFMLPLRTGYAHHGDLNR